MKKKANEVKEGFLMEIMEMIRQLYSVEELQGYTEDEIAFVKDCFGALPGTVEEFWRRAARTEAIHRVQDFWTEPEMFRKQERLRDSNYLILLIENQGCCRAGIRISDLLEEEPPVYVTFNERVWTLCAESVSEFLQAALAYEAIFEFPYQPEEFLFWFTKEELETVQSGLNKMPFELHGWCHADMSFYNSAPDHMVAVMDCGDLQVLYGAASEESYQKLMTVMEGLGEA